MVRVVVLFLLLVNLVGCGVLVEVPPACRGKILTGGGYIEGIKSPSTFRLPFSWTTSSKLVVAEVSDVAIDESLSVFMPKDELQLKFDVRGTFSVSDDHQRIESIFERVSPNPNKDNYAVLNIHFSQVYNTYALHVIRRRSRETIAKYSIKDVLSNREAISQELENAVKKDLSTTPINCLQLGLAAVDPPEVIMVAQEQAKKREIEIQRAEADKLVKLTEADAALEVAKKQQQVDLLEAETQVLVDKKLSECVNQAFVTQRALKVWEKLADNKNVIILPSEAITSPSIMMGVAHKALNNK